MIRGVDVTTYCCNSLLAVHFSIFLISVSIMFTTTKTKVHNLVFNHVMCFSMFFVVYAWMFRIDKTSFSGATDLKDILYFTSSTHSTTGYGDISAASKSAKMVVVLHQICVILLAAQMFWCYSCKDAF